MTTNRRPLRTALALAFVLLCSHSLLAGNDDKDLRKHYGLIYGTAYGPDDYPIYGVKIEIHPAGKKHPNWEQYSNHRGEFAVHVPPGPEDYIVTGEVEIIPLENGKPQKSKKKHWKAETKVHIEKEERQDISLHLAEFSN